MNGFRPPTTKPQPCPCGKGRVHIILNARNRWGLHCSNDACETNGRFEQPAEQLPGFVVPPGLVEALTILHDSSLGVAGMAAQIVKLFAPERVDDQRELPAEEPTVQ